ncbi:MAG TPA: CvpA family protein [Steroidobacteraceae bacterium]|nr:CvpA family protein [Steroidobacteraceae bacterium]
MHQPLQFNLADYAVIATLAISAGVGLLRGTLRETLAVLTWLAAVFVAWHFAGSVVPHLGGLLAHADAAPWAARALLLFAVLTAGAGIAAIVCHLTRMPLFNGTDRILGFLLGLVRGALIVGVAVIAGEALHLNGEARWQQSTLLPYGEDAAMLLRALGGVHARYHHELAVSIRPGR